MGLRFRANWRIIWQGGIKPTRKSPPEIDSKANYEPKMAPFPTKRRVGSTLVALAVFSAVLGHSGASYEIVSCLIARNPVIFQAVGLEFWVVTHSEKCPDGRKTQSRRDGR